MSQRLLRGGWEDGLAVLVHFPRATRVREAGLVGPALQYAVATGHLFKLKGGEKACNDE